MADKNILANPSPEQDTQSQTGKKPKARPPLTDGSNDAEQQSQPSAKKRRIHAKKACSHCRKAHSGCDSTRPCYRCRQKGLNCFEGEDNSQQQQQLQQHHPYHDHMYANTPTFMYSPSPSPHHHHYVPPPSSTTPSPYQQQQQQQQYLPSDQNEHNSAFDVFQDPLQSLFFPVQQQQQQPNGGNLVETNQQLMQKLQKLESLITQQSERINGFITNYSMVPSSAQQWTNNYFHPQQQQQSPPLFVSNNNNKPAMTTSPQLQPTSFAASPPLLLQQQQQVSNTSPITAAAASAFLQQGKSPPPPQQQQQQQQSIVAASNNNAATTTPSPKQSPQPLPDQHPSYPIWKILLNISHTMITVRDKNSLKLLSYNAAFMEWLTTKSSSIERMQERFGDGVQWLTKTVEPLFMVLLLNVIQDEAKLIHSLEMKTLWILGKKQLPLVIKTTFHVEDDFIWSEHSPVPNNEFDNAFKFNDDMIYAATIKFVIPENCTVEQAKALYENESKTRYMTMLEVLMNKRKK